jgi:hypothetical protein
MISYTEAAAKHSFCSTNLPHVRTTCCLQLVYILLRTRFSEVRVTPTGFLKSATPKVCSKIILIGLSPGLSQTAHGCPRFNVIKLYFM